MLALPGMPATAVTRPPPTAGPRLRNLMFSRGSLALLSSATADDAAGAAFCASLLGTAAVLLLLEALLPRADFSCAVKSTEKTSISTTHISFTNLFIGYTPADSR